MLKAFQIELNKCIQIIALSRANCVRIDVKINEFKYAQNI